MTAKDLNDRAVETGDVGDPRSGAKPMNAKAIEKEPARVLTVRDVLSESCDRALSKDTHAVCSTGVDELDKKTGGMRPGHVWVLGADTSWGKSSWAIMLADVNMAKGKRVLIVSTEDAPSMYGDRLMVRRSRVNALRFRDRRLFPEEIRKVTDVAAEARPEPFYLNCIGVKAKEAIAQIRKAIDEHSIDIVVLDYIQELRGEGRSQDRRNEINDVAGMFRTAVKQANKTGIMLSQLTIESTKKYPDKHSIRESRDISNGAEAILIGFCPQEAMRNQSGDVVIEAGEKCILVDKAKDGIRGLVPMKWDSDCACFDEIRAPHPADDIGFDGYDDG